jgi:uncharacterized CHY-type Zn-finger protein
MNKQRFADYMWHDGGNMPLTFCGKTVEIITRGGYITQNLCERIRWNHNPKCKTPGDVIYYRPVKYPTLPIY